MDPHRLTMLLELSRHGSMRAVADVMHTTTSTVSQQLAVLATEAGATLVEPRGRGVRLTPAGRRLADHAVTILAAIEAARVDLGPTAAPAGEVRVAAFATAIRDALLPVTRKLSEAHPDVRLLIHEHEPTEALSLLAGDHVDLALTYDYNMAPAVLDPSFETVPLWMTSWALGVPSRFQRTRGNSLTVFAHLHDHDWIVNSRNTADGEVVRTLASLAGFAPRVVHRADSLELVQEMIQAGLGVGLLPAGRSTIRGVGLRALTDPDVVLRAHAVVRRGRRAWPPLAVVLDMLD